MVIATLEIETRGRRAPRRIATGIMLGDAVCMPTGDLIVYHDGSCPLCRLEIGHYRKQIGAERIEFIDVSDPHVHPGPGLSREDAMRRFHARLSNGDLKSGASAFIEIWKVLPRWQPLGRIAGLPGIKTALDAGYTLFSPFRPPLARIVAHFDRG